MKSKRVCRHHGSGVCEVRGSGSLPEEIECFTQLETGRGQAARLHTQLPGERETLHTHTHTRRVISNELHPAAL